MLVSVYGHLPYEETVDTNATTLPTPGVDSPGVGMQSFDTEYISPVFGKPPDYSWMGYHTQTAQPDALHYFTIHKYFIVGWGGGKKRAANQINQINQRYLKSNDEI